VKNSAKVMLFSFNRTVVFLHDIMVSENDVHEAQLCVWWVCVDNLDLRL